MHTLQEIDSCRSLERYKIRFSQLLVGAFWGRPACPAMYYSGGDIERVRDIGVYQFDDHKAHAHVYFLL